MSFRRLRRLGPPLTGALCAVGGVAYLALVEVAPTAPPPLAQPTQGARVEGSKATAARRALAESRRARARAAARAKRPALRVDDQPLSPKARAARNLVRSLARTPELTDRLAQLRARVESFKTPGPALALLEGLLETPLRGDAYEVQTLRLAALGHVGRLALPEADAVLVGRLDGEVPRPERLVAIELLAARRAAREELKQVASRDHDPRVQERARWALAR